MKKITSFLFPLSTFLFPLSTFLLLVACGGPSVPTEYTQSKLQPAIYPDYKQVTVPVNIAPLSFEYDGQADEMVARYAIEDDEIVCNGQPDIDEWHALAEKAKGKAITVDVYTRKDDQWTRFKPFSIYVSPDSIDPYISYRLIAPSFISYESLTINQRCLENYDESVIYDNILCGFEKDGQCINCHHYQQYNPQRMQFHARQNLGGTVIAYDGKLKKVNMRNDSILSAGVYPAWHPWLNLIVYATDKTMQNFHVTDPNKVEVYDEESDIIAYDVETDEVTNLENSNTEFEVFPAWAPDGKTLYYCSAHFERKDTTVKKNVEVHYGYFHIWHHDADLWMLDLSKENATARPLTEANSADTESYHAWSSNGRWVIFSSRRDDGVFTRPFIAHIDQNGRASKAFELPSEDPDYHRQFMRSYNIPEFMKGPVTITPQTFADVLKGEAVNVKYKSSKPQ